MRVLLGLDGSMLCFCFCGSSLKLAWGLSLLVPICAGPGVALCLACFRATVFGRLGFYGSNILVRDEPV